MGAFFCHKGILFSNYYFKHNKIKDKLNFKVL